MVNLIYFILFAFLKSQTCEGNESESRISRLEFLKQEKELLGLACLATNDSLITHFRLTNQINKTIPCIIEKLQTNPKNGWFWSVLGSLYDFSEERSRGSFCFREARELSGKFPTFIKTWHFLGPFVTGKGELDGDPVEAFGGIKHVSQQRAKKDLNYFSELVPNGKVKWTSQFKDAAERFVIIRPQVDWGDLIQSLSSMAITEWQGWVVGEFAINANKQNLLIQCLGVHTIFIDDILMTGDIYKREEFKFAIYLQRGIHNIKIRLRAKVAHMFRCQFEAANSFIVLPPPYLPDIYNGHLISTPLTIPVINSKGNSWLTGIQISIYEQPADTSFSISQTNDFAVAPGQVSTLMFNLANVEPDVLINCKEIKLTLKISSSERDVFMPITLVCRKRGQSFVFTFLDHDNSVQHAGAIEPLENCLGNICPTLVTLHGTTISARDQADSYKRMSNGEYIFGLEKLWTLAPTRHGAHNWEGPGALTAMTALQQLEKLTQEATWFKTKSSASHVMFAGHSMGGHGALHLATHNSDVTLAVISLAGWIKKEEYGDSNEFFRHDIATSFADSSQRAVLQSCFMENDVDRHISNLQEVPVFLRIGAADRTVHPYFVRRLYRLFKEYGINVTYIELPDKEHWWWDTWESNDGGAVNDPQVRNFAVDHARIKTAQYCEKNQAECRSTTSKENKYGKKSNKKHPLVVTVVNPASTEGAHGLRILNQKIPFRQSQVQIIDSSKGMVLTTTNVQRLKLYESINRATHWTTSIKIQIDGTEFKDGEISSLLKKKMHLCNLSGVWQLCEDSELDSMKLRHLKTMGPARRIAEQPFVIIVGTRGSDEMMDTLLKYAVYIANLFYLTSDKAVPIMKDNEVDLISLNNFNLIIIGGPLENSVTPKYLHRIPLTPTDKGYQLGDCRFSHPQTGVLFLAPHEIDHLALIIMGRSLLGIEDVIRLATPTIPPMTRSPFSNMIPDFVITGPDTRYKGSGGFLCAGFWGNHWEFRTDLSTCAC